MIRFRSSKFIVFLIPVLFLIIYQVVQFLYNFRGIQNPFSINLLAHQPHPFPFVSILSLSNGQSWSNRNIILDVCYQTYPLDMIELIFLETSFKPSAPFESYLTSQDILNDGENPKTVSSNFTPLIVISNRLQCGVKIRYIWHNRSQAKRRLGALRNTLHTASRGDVIINMDNDDYYHPTYINVVVTQLQKLNASVLTVRPQSIANQNPDGTFELKMNHDPRLGAHSLSYTRQVAQSCQYNAHASYSEENNFMRCITETNHFITASANLTTLNSGLMIIKVHAGFGITDMVFFVGSVPQFKRMRRQDWLSKIKYIGWYVEQLHELSRPQGKPFLTEGLDPDLVP